MRRWMLVLMVIYWAVGHVRAQDAPFSAQDDFRIQASVDNASPFRGQAVLYTVRLYSPPGVNQLKTQLPDFEGFWHGEDQAPPYDAPVVVDGHQYILSTQSIILYPIRDGALTIQPVTVSLPQMSSSSTLSSDRVLVQVKPLPPGAPVGFKDAVGQFSVSAALDKNSVKAGEPVSLRLTIEGVGNIEQLAPPDLPVPSEWRMQAQSPNIEGKAGVGQVRQKHFEWLLIPDQPGSQTIPPIVFGFFDPQTITYHSVSTSALALNVVGNISPASNVPGKPHEILPLKDIRGVQSQTPLPDAGFWLLWLLPPGVTVIGWVWSYQRRRSRLGATSVRRRQSTALQQARARLKEAQQAAPQEAYGFISQAIYGYFGSRLNRGSAELTPQEIRQALGPVDSNLRQRVLKCLEWAEEGRYAPPDATKVVPLIRQTMNVLTAIDSAWGSR